MCLRSTRRIFGAAQDEADLQPVSEKILPADPDLGRCARACRPSDQRTCARPSNTTCSQTSSHTAITSSARKSGQQREVLSVKTVPDD